MRSGRCPKCQATEIHVGPISRTQGLTMNAFSVSFWRQVTPQRYICMSCGYMEQYVDDPDDRRAIAAKWPKSGWG